MPGRLEVISGCMFSGKTEELVGRLHLSEMRGRIVKAYKPKIDNRYSEALITSHTAKTFPATPIDSPSALDDAPEVVGIDEVQFFDASIVDQVLKLVRRGSRVVVSGLDLTYRGEPFGSMPLLLAHADDVLKLQSTCVQCGEEANRTQRKVPTGATVLVGGAEAYEPRCLGCFDPGA